MAHHDVRTRQADLHRFITIDGFCCRFQVLTPKQPFTFTLKFALRGFNEFDNMLVSCQKTLMGKIKATSHCVWIEDACNMEGVRDDSVDLVVTSPPYPMIQMWDDPFNIADPLIGEALARSNSAVAFERMHQCLDPVWHALQRVLKPGGIACINIGDATRSIDDHFQLFANHARVISSFVSLGFEQLPTIIWRKPTNAPTKFMGSGMLPPGAYVTLEHEYILIFRKGGKRLFSRDDEKQARRHSAYFWEERNIWFSDIWTDLRGTAQLIDREGVRQRSGAFPLELPYRLINMFSLEGETVLDPFLGTGTTMLAAMCAGRNALGFENQAAMQAIILQKIASAVEISSLLVRKRLQAHAIFVHERGKSKGALKYWNANYDFPVMTRQEIDLRLAQVSNLQYTSGNRFKVLYRDIAEGRPQTPDQSADSLARQWPEPISRGRQLKLF